MEQRFWSKVNKDGPIPQHKPELGKCWIWTASTNRSGRGQLRDDKAKNTIRAYKYSWILHNGSIPTDMFVFSYCKNPTCVNPSHLFIATNENDLTGKTFGFLRVISKGGLNKFNQVLWKCYCDQALGGCGNSISMQRSGLYKSKYPSCGCATSDLIRGHKLKAPFMYVYNGLKRSIERRNKNGISDITYEKYLEFTKIKQCTYCGDSINWQPNTNTLGKKSQHGHWLDRKDNTKGYYLDNVVVCCRICNRTKTNEYSYDEMLIIGKAIKQVKERRKQFNQLF